MFDGDSTIEEQTSIVNESYENSSSWESYETSSSLEAIEAEKYLDQNTPNESTTGDESGDKYLAIARLDDELENEKWEERTAVITSNDHQVTKSWIPKHHISLIQDLGTNSHLSKSQTSKLSSCWNGQHEFLGVHCLCCLNSSGCPRRG